MDKETIKSIFSAWQEVTEKKLSSKQSKHMDTDKDGDIDDDDLSNLRGKKKEKEEECECKESTDNKPPFEGPYRKVTKVRKDQYGNVIKQKNVAKHLAKLGMSGVKKEEVEQIDELKSSTLRTYNTKASDEAGDLRLKTDRSPEETKKWNNRIKGQKRAVGTLINRHLAARHGQSYRGYKEEVEQIDEISTKVKMDYYKASSKDAAKRLSHEVMMNKHAGDENLRKMSLRDKGRRRALGMPEGFEGFTAEEIERLEAAGMQFEAKDKHTAGAAPAQPADENIKGGNSKKFVDMHGHPGKHVPEYDVKDAEKDVIKAGAASVKQSPARRGDKR